MTISDIASTADAIESLQTIQTLLRLRIARVMPIETLILRRTSLIVPRSVPGPVPLRSCVIQRRTRSFSGSIQRPTGAQTHSAERSRVERAPAAVRLLVTGGALSELGTRSGTGGRGGSLQDGSARSAHALDRLVAGSDARVQSRRPAALVPAAFCAC